MTTVRQTTIRTGVTYLNHPQHRNNTPQKSQWRISEQEEIEAFTQSLNENWVVGDTGWGFHLGESRLAYLGVAQNHRTPVFLAKFVDGTGTSSWHGYPADHVVNSQDRPPVCLQRSWLSSGRLAKAKIRKLAKGQPCNL